jgi:hypothetical protein
MPFYLELEDGHVCGGERYAVCCSILHSNQLDGVYLLWEKLGEILAITDKRFSAIAHDTTRDMPMFQPQLAHQPQRVNVQSTSIDTLD